MVVVSAFIFSHLAVPVGIEASGVTALLFPFNNTNTIITCIIACADLQRGFQHSVTLPRQRHDMSLVTVCQTEQEIDGHPFSPPFRLFPLSVMDGARSLTATATSYFEQNKRQPGISKYYCISSNIMIE